MIIVVFVARIRFRRSGRYEYFNTFAEAATAKLARWLLKTQYEKCNVLTVKRKY
jgi:hypothetical protein